MSIFLGGSSIKKLEKISDFQNVTISSLGGRGLQREVRVMGLYWRYVSGGLMPLEPVLIFASAWKHS